MSGEALRYIQAAAPRSPNVHLLKSGLGLHVFVPDGSRLFDADAVTYQALQQALADGSVAEVQERLGLGGSKRIDDTPLAPPPLHALSLAVAQKCNLGCTYCYAQQGTFGDTPKSMSREVAASAVELLVAGASEGSRLHLSFLGGEPLANRDVIRFATELAAQRAAERGCTITFSITTNGTLVNQDDAAFFEQHGFAVTISLDGPREVHDQLRPFQSGRGSFDSILSRLQPLLAPQKRMQVSARVTVTPWNTGLRRTLDEFLAMGFHTVGFSPMLRSPNGAGEMDQAALHRMLEEMIACGQEFERRTRAGERYAFANLLNALREIQRGTHRPYPCGAGAGYFGVSAEGNLAACHRFVGDDEGAMGSVNGGVSIGRQTAWLTERHVHRQEPCNGCWARYLCGGGCHHEVIARGRPACDYIRGWLHYCLEAYLRLSWDGLI
jgi:uncharacterized protein